MFMLREIKIKAIRGRKKRNTIKKRFNKIRNVYKYIFDGIDTDRSEFDCIMC